MASNLSLRELQKIRGGTPRIQKFLEKMLRREAFQHLDGTEYRLFKITIDDHTEATILADGTAIFRDQTIMGILDHYSLPSISCAIRLCAPSKMMVYTECGRVFNSSELKKTKEFGGATPLKIENHTIQLLQQTIPLNETIDLSFNKHALSFSNVVVTSIEQAKPNRHEDMTINLQDGNQIRLSLKAGDRACHFQQYCGITPFRTSPEVLAFMGQVIEKVETNHLLLDPSIPLPYPQRKNFCTDISIELQDLAVFCGGPQLQRVHAVAQGDPMVYRDKNTYNVVFNKLFCNITEIPAEYRPMLYSRYTTDRNTQNPLLQNVRFMIAPRMYRRSPEILQADPNNQRLQERGAGFFDQP